MNLSRVMQVESSRGAALVELGIIVVPLLLLLVTFVEMGIAIRCSNVVIEASRAGARAAGAKSRQDPADLCGDPAALPSISANCSDSPTSSPSVLSAFHATCNFLASENFDLAQWRVSVALERRFEGDEPFSFFRLTLEQADPNKKNCVICLGGLMNDFRLKASSVFAVQRRCS